MILKRKATLTTSRWTGGTTTELALFPAGASYQERNFDFRISSATVETEQSEFTDLSGYNRILMVLDGQLEMRHEIGTEQCCVQLSELQQSHFDGAWKTTGFGKVTDFNVIFRYGLKAELHIKTVPFEIQNRAAVLYIQNGKAAVNEQFIESGDVCIVEVTDAVRVTPIETAVLLVVYLG